MVLIMTTSPYGMNSVWNQNENLNNETVRDSAKVARAEVSVHSLRSVVIMVTVDATC